jgi:hypothetical protein
MIGSRSANDSPATRPLAEAALLGLDRRLGRLDPRRKEHRPEVRHGIRQHRQRWPEQLDEPAPIDGPPT